MKCIRNLYRGRALTKELANPPVRSLSTFNSKLKTLQRSRTAWLPDHDQYDYLRNDIAEYLTDRISDIKRDFPRVVELGSGKGHVYQHLNPYITKELIECDWSEECLLFPREKSEIKLSQVKLIDETLPLQPSSADLVISNLAFHWVNDIPLMFTQVEHLLVPDGAFLGSMFCGDCLHELRVSLQQAEQERTGGISTHISPFATPQDIGAVLQSAGFVMITMDTEDITVRYPDLHKIMRDLQGMGESNALLRMPRVIRRDVMQAASAIYQSEYGEEDGALPLTFRVLYFIAWKHSNVAGKAKKRGSQTASLMDLDTIVSEKSGNL